MVTKQWTTCDTCDTTFQFSRAEWPAGIDPEVCADCGGWEGHCETEAEEDDR